MPEPLSTFQQPPITIQRKNIVLASLKNRFFIIFFLILICLATVVILLIKPKSIKHEGLRSEKELSAYNRTLEEQAKRSKARTPSLQPEFTREAKGQHTLHIVYTKPTSLNGTAVAKLMDTLNYTGESVRNKCIQGDCYQTVSLNYIKDYLDREKRKYGIKDFSITIKTHPLLTIDNLYKVGDIAILWDKDLFGITKLKDEFDKTLKKNNIVIGDKDLVAFLYLDDSFDSTTKSPDRFYEHKKFRSFADYTYGKTYLNIYSFEESFSATTVEILTHELLHLFGATDKYEENDPSRECSLRGLGKPDLKPLYPQAQGDIMCLYIEKFKNEFTKGSLVKNELNINKYTAKEIGWGK